MHPTGHVLYDDGTILCDDTGITIRWYYFPFGGKRIEYAKIVRATERSMGWMTGKLRLWGSGDLFHWYNLDWGRPRKETAIVIDQGGPIKAVITPESPGHVLEILKEKTRATV